MKKLQKMALGALMTMLITGVVTAEADNIEFGEKYVSGGDFQTSVDFEKDAAGFAALPEADFREFYGYKVSARENITVDAPAKYTVAIDAGAKKIVGRDRVYGYYDDNFQKNTVFKNGFTTEVKVDSNVNNNIVVKGMSFNGNIEVQKAPVNVKVYNKVLGEKENLTINNTYGISNELRSSLTAKEGANVEVVVNAEECWAILGIDNTGTMNLGATTVSAEGNANAMTGICNRANGTMNLDAITIRLKGEGLGAVHGIENNEGTMSLGTTTVNIKGNAQFMDGIFNSDDTDFGGDLTIKLSNTNEAGRSNGLDLTAPVRFINPAAKVAIDAGQGTAVFVRSAKENKNNGFTLNTVGEPISLLAAEPVAAEAKPVRSLKGAKAVVLGKNTSFTCDAEDYLLDIQGDIELAGADAWVELFMYEGDKFTGNIKKAIEADTSGAVGDAYGVVILNEGATWEVSDTNKLKWLGCAEDSVLVLNNDKFLAKKGQEDVFAFTSSVDNDDLYIECEPGAKMVIKGMQTGTYNIAENTHFFAQNEVMVGSLTYAAAEPELVYNYWDVYQDELADSAFIKVAEDGWQYDADAGTLKVTVEAKKAADLIEDGVAIPGNAAFLEEIGGGAGEEGVREFFGQVGSENDNLEQLQTTPSEAIARGMLLGEDAGLSKNALSVAEDVDNLLMKHLSFKTNPYEERGGYGPSLMEEDSGAGIWAEYLHGKDNAKELQLANVKTSYKNKYDGVLVGLDFKQVGDYRNGMAFHYVDGDSKTYGSGIQTKNDYDGWGVGYYGGLTRGSINYLFDVNYAQVDYDVAQQGVAGLKASPDTKLFSVGVRAEKLYENNGFKYVPYVGARFLSVDTDAYTATSDGAEVMTYAPERENIWLVPVGVSMSFEDVNNSGWRVAPKLDLSYVFAFGDTDNDMQVTAPGVSSVANMDYTVMDEGSFLGSIGLEASKGDWTFDLGYSYQKGDDISSDKWYVGAEYSF